MIGKFRMKSRRFRFCGSVAAVAMLFLCQAAGAFAQDAYEDDDNWTRAAVIDIQQADSPAGMANVQQRDFHDRADQDWVFFRALKDVVYGIAVTDVGENCDPVIGIYDTDGETPLFDEIDSWMEGNDEYTEWTCQKDGTYFARVRQYDPDDYGEGCDYRLSFYSPYVPFAGWLVGTVTPSCLETGFDRGLEYYYAEIECDALGVAATSIPCGGEFLKFMPAGTYTCVVSLPGYQDLAVAVEIKELERTDREFELTPIPVNELDFDVSSPSGHMPLAVRFNEDYSGQIASCYWEFGDGETSTERRPIHTFLRPGEYDVSLTVTDVSGQTYKKTREKAVTVDPILCFLPIKSADGWQTGIGVVNSDEDDSASGAFRAYDHDGQAVGDGVPFSLPPLGRKHLDVEDSFSDPSSIGYIVLEHDLEGLVGYTRCAKAGECRARVPAADCLGEEAIYLTHAASSGAWETEIVMANLSVDAAQVELKFNTGETHTASIPAGACLESRIRDFFDGVAQENIRSARITGCRGIAGAELFKSGMKYSGILLVDRLSDNMFFPHVASDDTWYTGVVVYNPTDFERNIFITPHTADGATLTRSSISVEANDKYIGVIKNLNLPEQTAWVEILSPDPVSGFELFGTWDERKLAGYTGVEISKDRGVFPELDGDGHTGIAFVNVDDVSRQVTLKAMNDAGKVVRAAQLNLNPFEKVVGVAGRLFDGSIAEATYILYEAQGPVVGFQLNLSSDDTMLDAIQGL